MLLACSLCPNENPAVITPFLPVLIPQLIPSVGAVSLIDPLYPSIACGGGLFDRYSHDIVAVYIVRAPGLKRAVHKRVFRSIAAIHRSRRRYCKYPPLITRRVSAVQIKCSSGVRFVKIRMWVR